MQKKEILEIIKTSFLNEDDKAKLIEIFETNGETEEFYKLFSQLIEDTVSIKGEKISQFIESFENLINENENEYYEKQKKLRAILNDELKKYDSSDIDKRNLAWNKYYEEAKKLHEIIYNSLNEKYIDLRRSMIE